jgi:hypothetical protein
MRVLLGVLLLCTLLTPATARAEAPPDGYTFRFGTDVRFLHDKNNKTFVAGTIPSLDVGYPIAKRFLLFELGWGMEFGFSKFYVDHFPDFLPSLGLRFYPFGKHMSAFARGGWSTFIFNKSKLTGEVGGDVDIPIGGNDDAKVYISLGGSYFAQKIYHLGDFIEADKWRMSSDGYAVRCSLVVRTFD